ncbi:unnamed protein product [Paramecium sonneborni]|uniref:Uncharacterized protein n=1 Tax=Paramecium sonneborni TaxID=65129 RepID=A0A8S1P404_9CILI|nr:unnamed protein product [Paramecium sonneborni]
MYQIFIFIYRIIQFKSYLKYVYLHLYCFLLISKSSIQVQVLVNKPSGIFTIIQTNIFFAPEELKFFFNLTLI